MNDVLTLLNSAPFRFLLERKDVTDISYNGSTIHYYSSEEGRKLFGDYSCDEALQLIRQIANQTNQLFTYQNPILDVVFDKYRLSAVHPLIGRDGNKGVITFAIRIGSVEKDLLISKGVIDERKAMIMNTLLSKNKSIVIAGQTSVGKTELQKYLIGTLKASTRVLIIDQGTELAILKTLYPALDITLWNYDEKSEDTSLSNLIKTALRFNPDYLVIAEARGKEILDIYNAALSGHPSIITIHSESEKLVYSRIIAMMGLETGLEENQVKAIFPAIIYLTKEEINGAIKRKIKAITYFNQEKEILDYLYSDEEET